jgi:hypothetical protein
MDILMVARVPVSELANIPQNNIITSHLPHLHGTYVSVVLGHGSLHGPTAGGVAAMGGIAPVMPGPNAPAPAANNGGAAVGDN